MKGWNKTVNRGQGGARKKQKAAGDHSVGKARQRKGPEAKASSLGFGGNKIQGLTNRPGRDNINGPMKGD